MIVCQRPRIIPPGTELRNLVKVSLQDMTEGPVSTFPETNLTRGMVTEGSPTPVCSLGQYYSYILVF